MGQGSKEAISVLKVPAMHNCTVNETTLRSCTRRSSERWKFPSKQMPLDIARDPEKMNRQARKQAQRWSSPKGKILWDPQLWVWV